MYFCKGCEVKMVWVRDLCAVPPHGKLPKGWGYRANVYRCMACSSEVVRILEDTMLQHDAETRGVDCWFIRED